MLTTARRSRLELTNLNSKYFFGPTVNFCVKMNKEAPPNGIIIGSDLHMTLNLSLDCYKVTTLRKLKECM